MFGEVEYVPARAIPSCPMAEQLDAIETAHQAGKLKRWGLSNETAWGVAKWASLAKHSAAGTPAMVQNAYNLLCRTADGSLVEACCEESVPLYAYSPLAMGLLTGKYAAHRISPAKDGDRAGQAACSEQLRWAADDGNRLVRYRGKYAEAEARCAPSSPLSASAVTHWPQDSVLGQRSKGPDLRRGL